MRQYNQQVKTPLGVGAFFVRLIHFIKARYAPRGARPSFAGSGEDIIMSNILSRLKIKSVFYIDIGAHHPVFGNNTYLFYKNGGRGVLVEPNLELCKIIGKQRPNDINLNIGVGRNNGTETFYSFLRNTRNTFSRVEAEAWEKTSGQEPKIEKRDILSLDTIITRYCNNREPDIISLDTEGYELEILSGFSWKVRPKIFCIEVVSSSGEKSQKNSDSPLLLLMKNNNYRFVAKTETNDIFVDEFVFERKA